MLTHWVTPLVIHPIPFSGLLKKKNLSLSSGLSHEPCNCEVGMLSYFKSLWLNHSTIMHVSLNVQVQLFSQGPVMYLNTVLLQFRSPRCNKCLLVRLYHEIPLWFSYYYLHSHTWKRRSGCGFLQWGLYMQMTSVTYKWAQRFKHGVLSIQTFPNVLQARPQHPALEPDTYLMASTFP